MFLFSVEPRAVPIPRKIVAEIPDIPAGHEARQSNHLIC